MKAYRKSVVAEWLRLKDVHPAQAHFFYLANKNVIDTIVEFHKRTREQYKALCAWREMRKYIRRLSN